MIAGFKELKVTGWRRFYPLAGKPDLCRFDKAGLRKIEPRV